MRAPSIIDPPSLVDIAVTTLRRMITGGQLLSGQRIVENQLTRELGISRPPLREALRVLEREGLVRQEPRKGVSVTELSLHDIYEIVTLRREFERLAVRLAIPVGEPTRLQRCHEAVRGMCAAAERGDEPAFVEESCRSHVALVGLSGNRRLEEAYRSLQLQLMVAMALTRSSRSQHELFEELSRHERLLRNVERGEVDTVLAELARHDERDFLEGIESRVDGHTEMARQWLHRARANTEET